jgi:hypothetical protein
VLHAVYRLLPSFEISSFHISFDRLRLRLHLDFSRHCDVRLRQPS